MNLGKRDGLNVGGMLRTICDATGLKSGNIGRIDIMASFSFFDTDNEHVDRVIKKLNGAVFEGHTINVEVSAEGKGSGKGKKSNHTSKFNRPTSGRGDKPAPGGFNKRRR